MPEKITNPKAKKIYLSTILYFIKKTLFLKINIDETIIKKIFKLSY